MNQVMCPIIPVQNGKVRRRRPELDGLFTWAVMLQGHPALVCAADRLSVSRLGSGKVCGWLCRWRVVFVRHGAAILHKDLQQPGARGVFLPKPRYRTHSAA